MGLLDVIVAWVRGVLCEALGHRFVPVRRITPEHTLATVYQCQRCGVES